MESVLVVLAMVGIALLPILLLLLLPPPTTLLCSLPPYATTTTPPQAMATLRTLYLFHFSPKNQTEKTSAQTEKVLYKAVMSAMEVMGTAQYHDRAGIVIPIMSTSRRRISLGTENPQVRSK